MSTEYHSPDWGRGHIAGWDEGFVRALEMVGKIVNGQIDRMIVAQGEIGSLELLRMDIFDRLRALREKKTGVIS